MRIKSIVILLLVLSFACNKSQEEQILAPEQKEATGTVWQSGGLYYCHSQIRTTQGDTLIPMVNGNNFSPYSMGQKVYVIYEELKDVDPGCNGIACEIIKSELIE